MQYSFCNLVVSIINNPNVLSIKYADFRLIINRQPDIAYTCIEDNNLELPDKQPIFECVPGTKIYLSEKGDYEHYYIATNRLMCKLTKKDGSRTLYYKQVSNGFFGELDLINSLLLENAMAKKGRFLLHSSFIHTKYGAVLFTAPSGTGKSTQADLWNKHRGAKIINGDRTCIWKEDGAWMAGGALWCGTSGIMKNEIHTLAAIVILQQGPVNRITPLRMVSKIARLMEQTTINDWDKEMFNHAQEFWFELCSVIPVYHLECTPDEKAIQVLEKELKNNE